MESGVRARGSLAGLERPAAVEVDERAAPAFAARTAASALPRAVPVARVLPGYRAAKRVFDLLAGGALLLLSLPLLALLAVAVRIESRGGVFFLQRRVGEGGRVFDLWKLRSMLEDAHERVDEVRHLDVHGCGRHFKVVEDPRVTKVGRLLRRTSLDELPQLWNVVRGDMSLVGPRPPVPQEVARYDARAMRRLSVPAGLTGLWQVSGRSRLNFERCIELDLAYVERRGFAYDLGILFATIPAVWKGDGAY